MYEILFKDHVCHFFRIAIGYYTTAHAQFHAHVLARVYKRLYVTTVMEG